MIYMNTIQVLIRYMRLGKTLRTATVVSALMFISGCGAITDVQLPDGVIGPATYNNREGAVRLTQATRATVSTAVASYIVSSGLLTDELTSMNPSSITTNNFGSRDQRTGHWAQQNPPHNIRALARLTRGVIGKYVPGDHSGWQSELFMYEAYAEILIAEGWCSGVPLSTLEFEGDWTYKAGSSTDEIYAHAIQLLDSATERAADSVSLQSVIRILKARAQLGLGLYDDAKQTVQGIDDEFRYNMRIAFDAGAGRFGSNSKYNNFVADASISNNEGINGLPYRSSGDPRTNSTQLLTNSNGKKAHFPAKYVTASDSSVFTLTSGIEAQLIIAEAALHENDASQMLTILNALRTSGTYTVDTTELVGGGEQIDTLWNAGIGGVEGLRPLTLPATPDEQRKLLFAERAAWLFLTGSRQGDLKRLVRKYGLDREVVYPTGVYTVKDIGTGSTVYQDVYGTDISFGIGKAEQRINNKYKGCNYDD